MLSDEDLALIDEFVRVVEENGLDPQRVVEGVPGLSGRQSYRYVKKGYRPNKMFASTRQAMREVIDKIGHDQDNTSTAVGAEAGGANRAFRLIARYEEGPVRRRFVGTPTEFSDPIALALSRARDDDFRKDELLTVLEWATTKVRELEERYNRIRLAGTEADD